jgi:hypothetical protein
MQGHWWTLSFLSILYTDHWLHNRYLLLFYPHTTCSSFSSRFNGGEWVQRDLTDVNVGDTGNGIFIAMYNLNIGAVISISIIPLS